MTSSNEVRKAVLTYMADKNWDDEITKYQIVQNIPYSRGAVYRNVPKLIAEDNSNKFGLLKKKVIEDHQSNLDVEAYALSLPGLITILNVNKQLWEKIDEIAEAQVDLFPLIFGKWEKLTKTPKLRDLIVTRLRAMTRLYFGVWHYGTRNLETGERMDSQRDPDEAKLNIYQDVISKGYETDKIDEETRLQWAKVVINDSQLRKFVKGDQESTRQYNERRLKMIEAFENANSPEEFVEEYPKKSEGQGDLFRLMHKLEEKFYTEQ